MHITITKIKNHKKITNLSFKFFLKKLFFKKYNYMSKIFPKIYFKKHFTHIIKYPKKITFFLYKKI